MSVLIKGMEMPENCKKCRCSWYDFTRLYCEADGKLWWLEVTEYADGRHPNCPLIEVPPHGRLIDEDALKSKINYTDDFYETPFVDWDDILEAPTVIPADKDGET